MFLTYYNTYHLFVTNQQWIITQISTMHDCNFNKQNQNRLLHTSDELILKAFELSN